MILKSELANATFHFELDDAERSAESANYTILWKMNKKTSVEAAVFTEDNQIRLSFVDQFSFLKAVGGSLSFETTYLGQEEVISGITIGYMDNQGPEIYMPTAINVSVSKDGMQFQEVRSCNIPFAHGADPEVKDMKISFDEFEALYVKVHTQHLKNSPKGGGVWLFVDEILVE